MSTHYYHCVLEGVPSELEEWVSEHCFAYGALGVSEKLQFVQDSDDYTPHTLTTESHVLDVYFERPPTEGFASELRARCPQINVSVSQEQNKDWLEEWKKGYEAFALTHAIWVVPSWKEPPAEAKQVIRIDPGMAFGTGTHETTQLAADLIYDLLQQRTLQQVLDVGTGTGILAILARQLGATTVCGTEIDEPAREVARENVERNGFSDIEIPDEQVDQLDGTYDLVVANIIDGILVRIQDDLKRLVDLNNGRLLVTGILLEREQEFLRRFALPKDWAWLERRQKGEWLGFLAGRSV